ncbi:MAG: GlsB/YeaQ/YmgE family stress response membrane protein [Betaproteobacteria bacterium]|nr:GlsB/YeaQ/YmgE family stress response membrane protein [Betaproteobacteria bacterium]MDE2209353.1 GlsB/YeaQ/YmgE family stress response membrane protein [Betaproteobacteria bacterium]
MDPLVRTILIGFGVGLVAKFMTAGRAIGAFIASVLVGIVGAVASTYVGRGFGIYHAGESAGALGALVGAVLLVVLYHLIVPRRNY